MTCGAFRERRDTGGVSKEDRALDVGEDGESARDVVHAEFVCRGDWLGLQPEETLENVTVLDGFEQRALLFDEHLREARIEMTASAVP